VQAPGIRAGGFAVFTVSRSQEHGQTRGNVAVVPFSVMPQPVMLPLTEHEARKRAPR
jgi:hypothetical protein